MKLDHLKKAIDALAPLEDSPLYGKLLPLYNRILVEPITIKTMGGEVEFKMPDNAVPEEVVGRVIAVGPGLPHDICPTCDGRQWYQLDIDVGDYIVVTGAAYHMGWEDQPYYIVTDDEVVAKVIL